MTATKNAIAQKMVEEFDRELATTRRFLERVPGDRLSWKPHEKSMSVGQLAHHIAETPSLTVKFVEPDRNKAPSWGEREAASNVQGLLAYLEESAAAGRAGLLAIDDERMREAFKIDLPDGSEFALPRERFLRSVMLNHWYHHRGQLGVYLRLLGVSVPSSYGPSGDEAGGI
jgi:uncharacterized damage-inducible protein DinB